MSHQSEMGSDWRRDVSFETRATVRKGVYALSVFALMFGVWSVAAPLSGAVIGAGRVISDGQNSLLQHPNGGKIAQIFVRDGQQVKKGEVVMALNPVLETSEVDRLRARHTLLGAQQARLEVLIKETDGADNSGSADALSPPELRGVAEADELVKNQNLELEEGLRRHRQDIQGITDQIEAQRASIAGLKAKASGLQRQSSLMQAQLARQRRLADEGYFPRNRLLETERQAAAIASELQSTRESVAAANAEVKSLEAKRQSTRAAYREDISQKLSDVRTQYKEIEQQIAGASELLQQTELRSPVDGQLVKLTNQTIGGVIRPGEVIAEIVPAGAELLVEAKLEPKDVVHVAQGNSAEVVFSGFNRHLVDPVKGTVTYVSPDSIQNERDGSNYFLARVSFPVEKLADRAATVAPGVAAEVFINTESRTFSSYLMKPVIDSFRRAFREP